MDAVTGNKRVWQTGSWQRSWGVFQRFRALIQNETLGKLTRFECGTPAGMNIRQRLPRDQWDERKSPPDHLDWDAWCAPVKDYPYGPMILNCSTRPLRFLSELETLTRSMTV